MNTKLNLSTTPISTLAALVPPSDLIVNFPSLVNKATLSATIPTSSIASLKTKEGSSTFTGKFKLGTFCSPSSKSINPKLNVLIFSPTKIILNLLSSNSNFNISPAFTLLKICFKFSRFTHNSFSPSILYSVKALLNNLKITITTLAGSIAITSNLSFKTLNLTSVTNSEITLTLSTNIFGSAKLNFIKPLKAKTYLTIIVI